MGYNTDKYEHGYIPIYEEIFEKLRNKELRLLEIGVFEGESLKMWREFFLKGKIVGVEIDPKRCSNIEGCEVINADATKYFQGSAGPRDIIIDDGSHKFEDILASFNLLWPSLNPGGVYVIEDIYGSNDTSQVIDVMVDKHKATFGKEFKSIELRNQLLILKK